MASTYSPDELAGDGINLKENLTSGTTYTFNVTASADGQAYLFMGNELHDSSLPEYFSGSVIDNLTDVTGSIIEPYKASVVIFKGNSSSFNFTPSVNIVKEDVKISATGNIGVNIGTSIPAPTPILYYDPSNPLSYSGTGTTINDLSGNGLNGTMSNITYTSPYFAYNGSSSQITIADNALLEPGSGNWTMEVWINQSVSGGDVILGKFNNGGASQDVGYSIRTTGTNYYAQLGSGTGAGGGPTGTLFVNSTSYTGTIENWYQIVYVFTNIGTKTLQTFINGVSIGSVGHNLASILNTTNPLYIGSYNGGEYSQWFDGKIGITRIYNLALTSDQILQNFNSDKSKYGL